MRDRWTRPLIAAVLSFAVVTGAGGWYVVNALNRVRADLPVTPLVQHQGLADVLSALSRLLRAVDTVRLDPTLEQRLEAVVALDSAHSLIIALWERFGDDLDRSTAAALNEALWLVYSTETLLDEENRFEPALLRAVRRRMSDTVETLDRLYLRANSEALVQLTRQANQINVLRDTLLVVFALVVTAVAGMLSLLLLQRHTARQRLLAQTALAEGEARYRDLAEGSLQGIVIFDPAGSPVMANRAYLSIFGYADLAECARSGTVFEHADAADREGFRNYVEARVTGSDAPASFESQAVRANGDRIWLQQFVRPVRWRDSDAVQSTVIDITERKRAEAELRRSNERLEEVSRRLSLALSVEGVGAWEIDLAGGRAWWSKELKAMLGHEPRIFEPDVDSWYQHLHPADRDDIVERTQRFLDGPEHAFEYTARMVRTNGEILWISTKATVERKKRGRPLRIVGIGYDMTGRRRAEEELMAAKQRSEEAYDRLKAAQAQLVQAEKLAALGGLVAGMAHEVNTPLGITLTAASTLLDDTRTVKQLADEGRARKSDVLTYLETAASTTQLILRHSEHAAQLIQGFKQVSVDQTSGERRSFELKAYLQDLVFSLHPQLRRVKHTVTMECPPGLVLDSYPGALSQAVTNLLVNSLMHAFPDGRAGKITLTVRKLDDGLIEMRYSDNGCGVPAADRDRIFEPFFTTKRGKGGSGLGLHIVHNLAVGRLGGSLAFQETPGGGATFVLVFPSVAPAGAEAPELEAVAE